MFDNGGKLIRDEACELILFQGDSITEMGRARSNDMELGSCYPMYVSSAAVIDGGKKVQCLNRAVGGERIVDLLARWKRDCLNLKPDIVSILIGVNDVWHELDLSDGVDVQEYEEVYDLLLNLTERNNPGTRFVIMEPFLLPGHATNDKWDRMMPEVRLRAEAARRVAEKHNALFIPLQNTTMTASVFSGLTKPNRSTAPTISRITDTISVHASKLATFSRRSMLRVCMRACF